MGIFKPDARRVGGPLGERRKIEARRRCLV
jgi:hypothetical protein